MEKHPEGSVQALSSTAATLLAVLMAFYGFWAYGASTSQYAWHWRHAPVLALGIASAMFFASVPLLATKPSSGAEAGSTLRAARRSLLVGCLLLLGMFLWSVVIDLLGA